jgi:hypothetical protein
MFHSKGTSHWPTFALVPWKVLDNQINYSWEEEEITYKINNSITENLQHLLGLASGHDGRKTHLPEERNL